MKYTNHIITPAAIYVIYNDGEMDKTIAIQTSDERYQSSSRAIKDGKFDSLLPRENSQTTLADEIQQASDLKETEQPKIPKIRKVRRKGVGSTIIAATDRLTIPAVITAEAGFKLSDELSVFLTDKRSRFLLICPTRHLKRFSKKYKCVSHLGIKSLSTGSVSLRSPTLAMAKIWPSSRLGMDGGERQYKVKMISKNLIEIRLS